MKLKKNLNLFHILQVFIESNKTNLIPKCCRAECLHFLLLVVAFMMALHRFISPPCEEVAHIWEDADRPRLRFHPLPFLFLQWKRRGIRRSPAAETALRSGWRSPGRPGRPSQTTSWRSWSAASSGRSTWAFRTAWSLPPPSTSPTHRSRPGTRTGGKDADAAS